ncbi:CU044_5270 family protein [Actinomadura rupiterrae]|uniref:CU044_5270 family protein n=1 Tax=Actinomadura rupiterrae TaxID=559627 RepID=UPI0020A428D1|nr:CU044_5270 family protein [Actinomadura rupiterrae]MCP2338696.1 hypothetical protein [Actinomadura rupiterrae]
MRARVNDHLDGRTAAVAPRRRIRPAWGLAVVGAAAAAVVATATLVPGNTGTGSTRPAPHASDDSGRTVLLAAAERAATQPTGKYWRVVTTSDRRDAPVDAEWVTLDGRRWVAYRDPQPAPGQKPGELLKSKGLGPIATSVLGENPPLSRLLALPTQPKALRALAERNAGRPGDIESVTEALVGLLTDQPTTPGTRAAAFRALADVPGVRSLGPQTDSRGRKGTGLAFDFTTPAGRFHNRLVIDPRTSQVLSKTTSGYKNKRLVSGTLLYLATGWTNESPRIP